MKTQKTAPLFALLVLTFLGLFASSSAFAQSGSLDASFGSGGKVTTNCSPVSTRSALLQPDGKIVVASTLNDFNIATTVFGTLRYNTNGSLDTGFGINGISRVAVTPGFNSAASVALAPDGSLFVAGYASNVVGGRFIAVAKLTPSGSLDASFGTGGKVTTIIGSQAAANVVLLQDDGKILVGGGALSKTQLARYLSNGTLDSTFGTGGVVNLSGSIGLVNSLAVETDGNILAYSLAAGFNGVAQFTAAGALIGPTPTSAVVRYATFGSEAVQSDGKFFYGTVVNTGGNHLAAKVTRYAENTIDGSFAVTNFDFTTPTARNQPQAVAIRGDGKVVVGGYAVSPGINGTRQFGVARLDPSGSLDGGFGTGGTVVTSFGGGDDQVSIVLPQSDGKLIAVGQSSTNVALARYLGP